VAGAELLGLIDVFHAVPDGRSDLIGAVADDEGRALISERHGGVDHVRYHRTPGNGMKHLRQLGFHAGSLAGCQDDGRQFQRILRKCAAA
jgi:hypothetical protein